MQEGAQIETAVALARITTRQDAAEARLDDMDERMSQILEGVKRIENLVERFIGSMEGHPQSHRDIQQDARELGMRLNRVELEQSTLRANQKILMWVMSSAIASAIGAIVWFLAGKH